MSVLEQLVGIKALAEAAIADLVAESALSETKDKCKHETVEDVTAAGDAGKRTTCVDCGETWEANDAN